MALNKDAQDRRKARVRRAIRKAANGRPRLSVFRSSKGKLKTGADTAAAKEVGRLVAERAAQAGVKDVVFDRSGYLYHGRVKALAEAAREGGLNF